MNQIPGDGDGADMAREEVVRVTKRAEGLQVALVALAGLAVVVASATAVVVGLGNRSRTAQNVRDTVARQEQTERDTAAAVQVILDYLDKIMKPHRLRNEAENRCQVELFARKPTILDRGSESALEEYDDCVRRRSGGTDPPPIPPNPLTTTTTGGKP